MATWNPVLVFGSVVLTSNPFMVRPEADFGGAQQVVTEVVSALTDGSLTKVTRYSNRTVTLQIQITGASLTALAQAETRLVAEARKPRNEFAVTPGDGVAPTSVYRTFEADLQPVWNNELEQQLVRRYTLTFDAHPWPRSKTKVITPAITAVAPTVVDNGSATTNWSIVLPAGATLSTTAGAVRSAYDPSIADPNGFGSTVLQRVTVTTSNNTYLAVDWKTSRGVYYWLQTSAAPTSYAPEVRREPGPTAGYTRSWYQIPAAASMAYIRFGVYHLKDASPGSATLDIDQVIVANALPAQGTTRQKASTLFPAGSVPAEGDIIVQHASSTLGRTIVFTHPVYAGYSPPLRPWRTAGSSPSVVTTDANQVSGAYDNLTTTVYSVPIDTLPPGSAHLWVKMSASSTNAVRLNWSATAWQGGVAQVGSRQSGSVLVQVPTAGPTYMFPVARMTLPPSQVTGPLGYVVFVIDNASYPTITVGMDEVWVFAMDEGTLTVVDCGDGSVVSGTSANRLRVSAPSIDAPYGNIVVATAADWSDSWQPGTAAVGCDQRRHRFNPEGSMIFTVTSAALDAAVSLEHFPAWHSNAGS